MDKPAGHHTGKRRGRPPTLPWADRIKWVQCAEAARLLALKSARMQEFDRVDARELAKLPAELQLIVVVSCWGRHSRHLDARALRLIAPPPRVDRLIRQYAAKLTPEDPDRSQWSPEASKRFELLRQLRRAAFGKAANVDAHFLMERIHIEQPAYVGGIAGEIDRWIAQHLKVSYSAIRSWRRQYIGDFMLETHTARSPTRRSGRDLMTRMAQCRPRQRR
jgi:hypothetical protein